MGRLPPIFSKLDPIIQNLSDLILNFQSTTGLPWPCIVALICVVLRFSMLPLFILQLKKLSNFGLRFKAVQEIKRLAKTSSLSKFGQKWTLAKFYLQTTKHENLQPFRFMLYNMVHLPILVFVIMSLRRTIAVESIRTTPFLWMDNSYMADPYYILPLLTCGIFYYTFGKGITRLNQDTLLGRVRLACQKLMIMWFVFLCHWPGSITFYIFCNAVFSLGQSRITSSPYFLLLVNKKVLVAISLFSKRGNEGEAFNRKINSIFKTEVTEKVNEAIVLEKAWLELKHFGIKIK